MTIKNIEYTSIPNKKLGVKVGNKLTQSNVGSYTVADYLASNDFYTLVNAIDIDWNGIQIDQNTTINDTSDLINWIKSLYTGGTGSQQDLSAYLKKTDISDWAKASTKPSYSYSEISNTPSSLPASDVSAWAKASTKPTYNYSEIQNTPSSLPASDVQSWAKAATKPSYYQGEIEGLTGMMSAGNLGDSTPDLCTIPYSSHTDAVMVSVANNLSSIELQNNPPYGHGITLFLESMTGEEYTVAIAHDSTNRICPNGDEGIILTVPATGYAEVSFYNAGNKSYGDAVFVRAL